MPGFEVGVLYMLSHSIRDEPVTLFISFIKKLLRLRDEKETWGLGEQ